MALFASNPRQPSINSLPLIVDPENVCLDAFSVDAVAAAVSGFFRELPEPLLTRELCDEFIRATGEANNQLPAMHACSIIIICYNRAH